MTCEIVDLLPEMKRRGIISEDCTSSVIEGAGDPHTGSTPAFTEFWTNFADPAGIPEFESAITRVEENRTSAAHLVTFNFEDTEEVDIENCMLSLREYLRVVNSELLIFTVVSSPGVYIVLITKHTFIPDIVASITKTASLERFLQMICGVDFGVIESSMRKEAHS